ncbi:hypothetical protein [Alloalcanivorax xenomutans]
MTAFERGILIAVAVGTLLSGLQWADEVSAAAITTNSERPMR